ncbi:hypothetical protein H5968_23750 [Sphaerospermopsis sp. LEGE 00249]|uniref:hypothetical protein n=1 Tax=Sphaerospermopsis sp. LEGE 00249 TaxID=1380707 RepID=UPI00164D85A0|nr:hypothetical protein [Sphaerospermopsis sp. LEGE 00249]MBC5798079.1 hypothetical protein [Sphaerospermopsis sp. LEGE 00249]
MVEETGGDGKVGEAGEEREVNPVPSPQSPVPNHQSPVTNPDKNSRVCLTSILPRVSIFFTVDGYTGKASL